MKYYSKPGSFLILVLMVFTSACDVSPEPADLESARKEILRLHNLQRAYHFEKDSIAFAESQAADMISVGRGTISYRTQEENIRRYNSYFSAVEFKKWDDTSEPIIRFSPDGKMAYTVVEKEVVLVFEEEGKTLEETTNYAWVAIYRKGEDGWKIECVAGTNKPSTVLELSDSMD